MKVLTIALAFVAMLFVTSKSFAGNGSSNLWTEECGSFYNYCCDETIDYCIDVHYTLDKNGIPTRVNAQGKGTGSNGTNYVITVNENVSQNIHDNGGGNYTITLMEHINATGSDCGFTMKWLIHVTVNANGETTATVEKMEAVCENGIS
jgi:hypothetical protein